MNGKKTAIVCGADGFVGRALSRELLAQNYNVIPCVRNRDKISKVSHFELVLEYADFFSSDFSLDGKETVCFNLAWAGVAGSLRADYHLQLENVERHLSIFENAQRLGISCYVGVSSISETEAFLYLNQDGFQPGGRFIYSIAKMTMNYMSKVISGNGSTRYVNVKLANLFGPSGLDQIILHDTIIKLLRGEQTSFTSGEQWYDFLFIDDAAKGLVALAEGGDNNTSYYLGSGHPRRLKDYLTDVGNAISPGRDLGFGKIASEYAGLPYEAFVDERVEKLLKNICRHSFADGLSETIEYYSKRIGISPQSS